MAQQLDDNDLLNLFSAVGRVVSKQFLMKRPALNSWQLVIDYLTSAMGFELREQFRVLYLDKRNNLVADEVLAEGIRWRRGGHALWSPLFLMSVWDLCEVAAWLTSCVVGAPLTGIAFAPQGHLGSPGHRWAIFRRGVSRSRRARSNFGF